MSFNFFVLNLLFLVSFILTAFAGHSPEKIVILGSGPSALTAAIFAGQAKLAPLVIEAEENDGQLAAVYRMENYPGFPEGINGDELVERIRLQAANFGARFTSGTILEIDVLNTPFRVSFNDGRTIYAESLIVALGTTKRWVGLDSEKKLKGKGVSGSALNDGPLFGGREVVVLGGGDAALQEALALTEHASKITLIHRGSTFTAAPYLQERVAADKKIHAILDVAIEDITGVSEGRVTGVTLRDIKTEGRKFYPCEGVFVSLGRQPNTDFFKGQLEIGATGLLVVEPYCTATNIPGVFAAGDISDPTYRKAITAAATGCMAAMDAIKFLSGSPAFAQ